MDHPTVPRSTRAVPFASREALRSFLTWQPPKAVEDKSKHTRRIVRPTCCSTEPSSVAAHLNGVDRFCFASSACAYPVELQAKGQRMSLREDMVDLKRSGASSDGENGWAKLMGEMALADYGRVRDPQVRNTIACAVFAGILPLFLFVNLHFIHEYYQVANLICLMFGIAVVIGVLPPALTRRSGAALGAASILVGVNLLSFRETYAASVKAEFTASDSRTLALASVLREEVPKGSAFVAISYDWDSSLAYLSERKSFTVPPWFSRYEDAISDPGQFLGGMPPGAVVACPTELSSPSFDEVVTWSRTGGRWRIGRVHDCAIALPETPFVPTSDAPGEVQCRGTIEVQGPEWEVGDASSRDYRLVSLTIDMPDGGAQPATRVYSTLTEGETLVGAYEAVPDPTRGELSGYTRVLSLDELARGRAVGVILDTGHTTARCDFQTPVRLDGDAVDHDA